MNNLVVLGSVNADHVLQIHSFPRPGETLIGHNYQVIPGGKGANQAVAAARLNADVAFIACVGDDDFGYTICQQFKQDGMNISAIENIEKTPTGIAMIQVSASGENSICLSPEANNALNTEYVKVHTDLIEKAQYLLTQLETPIEGIEYAVNIAKKSGTKVILNPAPAQALSNELLANIDIITPNETEAELLTGVIVNDNNSAQQAANVLHEKGIAIVLITLGAKGVWLSENGMGTLVSGFKVNAIDTTAAGDTFNGALVTALLEKKTLRESILFGHAAAALSVTKFGAQTSIPSRILTDDFLCEQIKVS